MPTAKEASQWFGIVMMLIFGPLYGVTAFVSYPDSPFVQFLSLFPLTSPIPLMCEMPWAIYRLARLC